VPAKIIKLKRRCPTALQQAPTPKCKGVNGILFSLVIFRVIQIYYIIKYEANLGIASFSDSFYQNATLSLHFLCMLTKRSISSIIVI
jgi:hypothetical protein